jgi:hypothetical protein
MGKPMGRHPITHYKNPKEPLAGSTRPAKQVRSMISAPPGRSFLDHYVEVQKVVKPYQRFLKTWSRANMASGGICTLWNSQMFRLEYFSSSPKWLQVTLTHLPLGKILFVFNICMPSQSHDKILCWRSLLNMQERYTTTSLIFAGAFNTTLHTCEKWGGHIVRD